MKEEYELLLEAENKIRNFVSTHERKEIIMSEDRIINRELYLELETLYYNWMILFLKSIDIKVASFEASIRINGIPGKREYYSETYYINKLGTKVGSIYSDDKVIEVCYSLFSKNEIIAIQEFKFQIEELKTLIIKVNESISNLTKLSPAFALDSL